MCSNAEQIPLSTHCCAMADFAYTIFYRAVTSSDLCTFQRDWILFIPIPQTVKHSHIHRTPVDSDAGVSVCHATDTTESNSLGGSVIFPGGGGSGTYCNVVWYYGWVGIWIFTGKDAAPWQIINLIASVIVPYPIRPPKAARVTTLSPWPPLSLTFDKDFV